MGMRTISEGAYLHSGEGNLRPAACLDREIGALKGGNAITHRVSQIPGYATDTLQGALKMTDMKKTDLKLTDHIAGHEITGHEIAGHENARHEIARQLLFCM